MRAIAINEFGGREKLQSMELPRPGLEGGDVLIEIRAAGVNPVDWKIREGGLKEMFTHVFPLIPGWDAAGFIRETAADASTFAVGDEVYAYCRKPIVQGGTYAEFVSVPESYVALKPRTLSFVEAASIPLACLTAFQSLYDTAAVRQGDTVLVHAAAGGVGTFAVQLARFGGATVLGTAGAQNHDYLRKLGVERPIDYRETDVRDAVKAACPGGVDVIFDLIGGETLAASREMLAEGGRVVSIVDPDGVQALCDAGVNASFVFVEPNQEELKRIAEMVDAGQLKTTVSATLPLEEAAKAQEMSEAGHVRGKIVLTM